MRPLKEKEEVRSMSFISLKVRPWIKFHLIQGQGRDRYAGRRFTFLSFGG